MKQITYETAAEIYNNSVAIKRRMRHKKQIRRYFRLQRGIGVFAIIIAFVALFLLHNWCASMIFALSGLLILFSKKIIINI